MTILLLMLTQAAAFALQAPDFTITAVEKAARLEVTAVPPAGHHINIKAPMSTEGAQVGSSAQTGVTFVFPDAKPRDYTISLFLCDNANTFCEKHQVSGKWDGKSTGAAAPSSPAAAPATGGEIKKGMGPHGFILNDATAALAKAKAESKPLLVDFFGIWCPPCNMLDTQVFPSREFARASAGFIKLKLDADSPVSWELKSRYHVSGYPTVVFASPDGDEIGRIVGFRSRSAFVKEIKRAWEVREEPVHRLKAKADSGDRAASDRLGIMFLERQEYESAIHYLEGTQTHQERLLDARIDQLENASSEEGNKEAREKFLALLKKSIGETPDSLSSLFWRMKLAELHEKRGEKTEQKALLDAVTSTVDRWAADPSLLAKKFEGHDMTLGDLWETAADARESMSDAAGAKTAWLKAAAEYRAQATSPKERGANLELAFCLSKAGDLPAAEKIYAALEKAYPREFTFYFNHARALFESPAKDAKKASPLVTKALEFSYGDNKLRTAMLAARVYDALGERDRALKVVRETLRDAKVPADSQIRTSRYVKKLQDLEKSLTGQKS
jgi:thiol-disulfide isomerase/thioredoxin